MNEPPQDVLLDSSTYFRLAQSICPLLQPTFGASPAYSLYVLLELDDEYRTSTRLHHKFGWVDEAAYRQDRQLKRYELHGKDRIQSLNVFSFLVAYADEQKLNLSREDLKALAVGCVKNIPVVTDDVSISKVANAHSIVCWSTIKLLRVMLTAGRIDMDKVKQILEYWVVD